AAIADARAGFYAALLLNLSPVFGVTTGTWVLPDGPLDCALLAATLALIHALPTTGRRHRHWLARPAPWLAVLLAALIFAPVAVWNATHGWASFAFQGGRATGLR